MKTPKKPKVTWLCFVDTNDDPIPFQSATRQGAKDQLQRMCYDEGYGELNVGPIGLIKIIKKRST